MERRRVTNMETVASEMKKTAELIELPFGMVSGVGPRNRVLCGHAHWRHLADTVERLCAAAMSGSSPRDGDAACSQITLGNFVVIID